MKIAFWSPLHGTGTTLSLLAAGIAYGELKGKKIILTQTHYNLNNLERPLIGNIGEEDFFRDTGMDAVLRYFKSGNVTGEQISDCTIKVGNNLFLLAGTRNGNGEGYESTIVKNMILHIISLVEQYYDLVLIDTNSGNNEYSLKIMEECDVVVVLLDQNMYMLDSFFGDDLFPDKKVFYLFADYDPESKYNIRNLSHRYKKMNKDNTGKILHSTQFTDAVCDERVLRYIKENIDCDSNHADHAFFEALRETVRKLDIFTEKISGIGMLSGIKGGKQML